MVRGRYTTLVDSTRRAQTSQYLAMRSRIVLACAQTAFNRQVTHDLEVSVTDVNRWRSRFVKYRWDGPHDEPRPGRPTSVSLDQVEEVVTHPSPIGHPMSSHKLPAQAPVNRL
ncbi:hypothetical protein GCM10022223_52300 [Kineosporia mesophila]|uniref:Transposase n=1 Tax=Kineosporia mesophila TaxID=566012 RepID=A0ABP7AAR3_9ACTN